MSGAHRRAARRELEAARAFGVKRTQFRLRFESRPDIEIVRLHSGLPLCVEVKTRASAPKLILQALEQARRYEPAAVPVAVISQTGGEAIACLPLRAFVAIAGIEIGKAGS